MIRVEVKNFQSIKDETVDIDGFAVVVGRSNIGKSALVRAIKAALTGAPADNYVRHSPDCPRTQKGAKSCKCFCSVQIQGPEFDLLWEKGDSINRYVHNGTEHTVVGKGTPEFLGPGLQPIYIGGDSTPTLLQVADQFRPLFILDRSGTAVADVLSDVAKLDQINEASRAAERDRRECSSTRKVREKDLKELDKALALYDGLDEALIRVKAMETLEGRVASKEATLQTLERFATSLTSVAAAIRALQPIEGIVVRSPASIVAQSNKLMSLLRWCRAQQVNEAVISSLRVGAEITVPEISSTAIKAQAYPRLVRWVDQLVAIKATFAKLKIVEAVPVPEVRPTITLYSRYQTLSSWADRMSSAEVAARSLQKAKEQIEVEEAAVLAEFKSLEVCPMCRQPIQISEHVHKSEAAHA